jgi:hypothetical protein
MSDIAVNTWSNTKNEAKYRGIESWPFAVAQTSRKEHTGHHCTYWTHSNQHRSNKQWDESSKLTKFGHGGGVDCCVLRKMNGKRTRDVIVTPVENLPSLRETCVPRLQCVLHVSVPCSQSWLLIESRTQRKTKHTMVIRVVNGSIVQSVRKRNEKRQRQRHYQYYTHPMLTATYFSPHRNRNHTNRRPRSGGTRNLLLLVVILLVERPLRRTLLVAGPPRRVLLIGRPPRRITTRRRKLLVPPLLGRLLLLATSSWFHLLVVTIIFQ